MKKTTLATMALIAAITVTASNSMAAIAISGTSFMGKVERVQNEVAAEAALVLMQGGQPSDELVSALEACREKQVSIIGAKAASELSDEALLLIISNQ